VSQRDAIRMTDDEARSFLEEERTLILATIGPDGWPHLMPLSYVVRDGTVWAWTYARSQKLRNLERDDRCTIQIETGGEEYSQMRGVMLRCRAELHRDVETVAGVGLDLGERYGAGGPAQDDLVARQAPKRVAIRFAEAAPRVSWDHRKLSGRHAVEA
jgi:PPOX class probable F420-dependent enzyme